MTLRHIELVALNIDGVLLDDTFSPVIHRFVTSRGGQYTADLETVVFSQSRLAAARVLARALNLTESPEGVIDSYFRERQEYLAEHPLQVLDGAERLLERVRAAGARLVCYGGLDRSHFDRHLGRYAGYFDEPVYVCTNDFRPGVREIIEDVFRVPRERALFVDDVANVARTARGLGVPFVGHPSGFAHGFQRRLMQEAGVRHIIDALDALDEELLDVLDEEGARQENWAKGPMAV
jgi:phosphoglycolate phosphatase-like HAD superfamily hydrolase